MGRGQKGKGKQSQKQNSKPTHRSAQNKKQLAKVERILQNKKDRSQPKNQKDYKSDRKFVSQKDNQAPKKGRQFSTPKGQNSRQSTNEWTQKTNKKTKQITKNFSSGKQTKKKPFYNQQQESQIIKGNPLFKIIPEGMDKDGFAALGGDSEEQQHQNSQIFQGSVEGQDYELFEDEAIQDDEEQEEEIEEEIMNQNDMNNQEEVQQEYDNEEEEQQDEQQFEEQQQKNQGQQYYGEQQQKGFKQQQQEQGSQEQNQENEGNMLSLPDDKEPVDISVISLKIQQTIQILINVAKLGGGKSRKDYLQQLKNLIHQYYGYNFELISHFLDFFNPSELIQFFEANQTQRPLTIRTNTLKTRRKELAQSLIQRGVNLDPLADWSSVGIKIYETKVPIGATPEYLAGQYMLQSASSFLPVVALDPQPYQKILDMASAPGGKTTYIAQLMKNTGCIFANDLKKERLRALQFNLYRLGVTNTAVICRDGRKFPSIFPSTFDRILLDAPCTGLGIISKDPSIKATRQMIDVYKNSHLQKQLLLAAIDCCKVNGTIVYSTCSVSPLQNEEVVNYALKRRFIKIVQCGIDVGEQGLTKFVEKRFHVDLKKTRRIYPHVHNMDGFYVAKLIKINKGKKEIKQEQEQEQQNKMIQQIQEEKEA